MNFVIDTNILLLSLINKDFADYFESNFNEKTNSLIISAVTEGELYSLALQRNWGLKKISKLEESISSLLVYPVRVQSMIMSYARIDAFSQGKLTDFPLYPNTSARNMGKNDLWIAATADVVKGTLITTDKDFSHLADTFFPLVCIDIKDWK